MRIDRLDHLVLTVADVDATVAFYTRVLGMEEVTFEGGRRALLFGQSKINLHQAGREYEPKAARPTPGSADLCFISAVPLDVVIASLNCTASRSRRARSHVPARTARSRASTCATRTRT